MLPYSFCADLAAHQPVVVDLRLGREHAHEQLLFRHFEAEEAGDAARRSATCCAMLSTRLVLPIDGRAATMIRSPRWKPRVILSISVKPVRDAGDEALVLEELLDLGEALLDQIAHRRRSRT